MNVAVRAKRGSPVLGNSATLNRAIYILGVGNLGKLVAHSLARREAAAPVTLLFHRPGLLADWEASGRAIKCTTDGVVDTRRNFSVELLPNGYGTRTGRESGSETQHRPPPIHYLVVTTKAYSTLAALELVKDRIDRNSTILFLQNGIGTTKEVSDNLFVVPNTRPTYLAGICSAGVYSTGPFSIVHAGRGPLAFHPESLSRTSYMSHNHLMQQLVYADALDAAMLSPASLREAQLRKLVVNSIINPLTAIFNCKNGELFADPKNVALMSILVRETSAIVRALLPQKSHPAIMDTFTNKYLEELVLSVAEKTGGNTSSMLQDVRAGRRTEIDYMNGYLVESAGRLNLPCEHNAAIVRQVRQLTTV
ncbi:ketopantoate reductase PanE/ApbA C terminal-domain-containing protein [Lasiosphaeria ovina]|uniref:2-dehydropantoate 2-reductase n=1 Tax=Lasiosphaeria ovina TaxID=92902 RepID=A0AAE0JRW4_9PEZI|nr:ketopantoate reductase PanE/ApbA C terminal-domain-containing protein [Lasiosphaeria ovina]